MKSLLLHACCAPCAVYPVSLLSDFSLTVFYYNPNITDADEYSLRLNELQKYLSREKIDFAEGKYDPEVFLDVTYKNRNDGERSERCRKCISMRLEESFLYAEKMKFDAVSTALSISPHKSYEMIKTEGERLSSVFGIEFLPFDFKKNGGFAESVKLSKENKFYRQNYCGCCYSKAESVERRNKK
ncbi:MAG TPA: epoxyqueuosine reductase QueH [Spirochaetota bacterium]|nr:epoxyqueuosine reductase QueH [Spirochaetota bacterium]